METPTPNGRTSAERLAEELMYVMGVQKTQRKPRYVRAQIQWLNDNVEEDVLFIVGEYEREHDDGEVFYWLRPDEVHVGFENHDVLDPRITDDMWRIVRIY